MFPYIRFRWGLWQLEREQRRVAKKNAAQVRDAKARKLSADDIYAIESEGAGDYWHFQDESRKLHSQYLYAQAARLIVPRSDLQDKEMWEHEPPNRVYLTEKGINHMRAAIRAERKGRAELFLMYVPGVVGILGTLIGLASILVSKH